jgi:FkbM family methyltransferase
MRARLMQTARNLLKRNNLAVMRYDNAEEMLRLSTIGRKLEILRRLPGAAERATLEQVLESQSQLGQDFFVLSELDWRRNGFFVEFGATNGKSLSNSWLLEKAFGWAGILAEPARVWRDALAGSGRNAAIDFDCVWSRTGEKLTFLEAGEISTVAGFAGRYFRTRRPTRSYEVETVSLNDLLARHNAPPVIDYLSIDTEGSEFDILSHLDFARYRFRCITCEHDHTPNRERIHALLTGHGYRRKFEELSDVDDWYVYPGD